MDGLWAAKSEGVSLIDRAISFQDFQPMWSWSTNVTDRRTDGRTDRRTTCNLNTALCTSASRGKNGVLPRVNEVYSSRQSFWASFWVQSPSCKRGSNRSHICSICEPRPETLSGRLFGIIYHQLTGSAHCDTVTHSLYIRRQVPAHLLSTIDCRG